jgi:Flp pilus assembly protein TadG
MTINLLRHFAKDRGANVAIIFALAALPTIYLAGMGLDYSSAVRRQSQLDAAADAAAISAVTPAMMAENSTVASTQATNVFNAKAVGLGGLTSTPVPTVTITNNGLVRTATVSYTAAANNNFPTLLGKTTWSISGTSSASSTVMPNINFYLLLDSSPSMAIAGTPAGISTMIANTQAQVDSSGNKGCAFACHESNPSGDSLGNPGGEDNYALARALGVTLRIDLMSQAVATLMSTAKATETANGNTYKMAIYTFDTAVHNIVSPATSNLTTAANDASNISVLEVYDNNWLTSSNNNSDADTDFSDAMSSISSDMPAPGGGTNTAGDTPQEVMFVVSDGVEDKTDATCSEPLSNGRCQQPFDTTWCTTIKNRGIRIAVLYTEYLQLPTNAWYNTWISPFDNPTPSTSTIATNMQSCASPGLFFDVASGGDISSAMTALFQQAVATARLTQ